MEIPYYQIAFTGFALALVTFLWSVLNWVWLTPKKLETYLRKQGLQGNSYKFLFGDMKEMSGMIERAESEPILVTDDIVPRVIPFNYNFIKKYGMKSFAWLGPKPTVHVMNPELIKEIMKKNLHYEKPKTNPLTRLLITGIVDYEGEKWAKHRKIINPAFHLQNLKKMLPAFYTSCNEMISKWEKLVPIEGTSTEVNVWPCLETLSRDALSRAAFGSSFEEGTKIFQLQDEQIQLVIQASQQTYIPGWRFLPTKANKRIMEIEKLLEASLREIITKRMNKKEGENSSDLLSILLESNSKEINETDNNKKKNVGMSINEVIKECKVFYLAGQETTSALLLWTMVLLSTHQEWQDQARQEVLEVFGNNKPDFDGLNQLKVVTMIFHEVLRLYPPVVVIERIIHEETKLGDMSLPAGVQLSIPILLIHRDTKIWGSDAKEFKPERFVNGVSKATNAQQGSYFPFGSGPRICIGQNFAMLEAKMALALILQRFSFELSSSYSHAPHKVITMHPQHGAHRVSSLILDESQEDEEDQQLFGKDLIEPHGESKIGRKFVR